MKENNFDQIKNRNLSAAENNNASHSLNAPEFNPSIQLKSAPIQMEETLEEDEKDVLQGKAAPFQLQTGEEDEEEIAQKKVAPFQLQEEELMLKEAPAAQAPQQSFNAAKSSKTSLPEPVQAQMESTMGADFSNVNIHKDSEKATGMGALAYAQGSDVHFAPGQFRPESTSGQELIGHELAHVVQQREGRVTPTTQKKGQNVNDNAGLEQEADQMGREAAKKKK